jgi:glyoxylase-like metal-dependent hydrolase (beta-lactamase superfamily II)/rhodanese-related sulfurtransferase
MPATTQTLPASIAADDLAARLGAGTPTVVLDVRDEASWTIDGPPVIALHLPAERVVAAPATVARELPGPTVVVCNRGITAQKVASALREAGADATALDGGLRGWIAVLVSQPLDLGAPGLTAVQVQRPGRGCLSYVLAAGGRALVVDPAPGVDHYLDVARSLDARITDVVDTHLHADHLSGARALAAATGAALRLPAAALDRGVTYGEEIIPLHDDDVIALGDVLIRAIALPGHTTDMTGLLVADRALIGGDSLFADGIARPDLQQSDPAGARAMACRLYTSIHDRILMLGDHVLLLPGHTHPGVLTGAIAPSVGAVRARVPELALHDPQAFADDVLADMPPRPANYESIIAVNAGTHPFDPDLESGGNSCSAR